MKSWKFAGLSFVFAVLFLPLLALAQDAVPAITNDDFISSLLASIGGIKGAGTLAIAMVVVQLLMKFVGTPWADSLLKNNGQWKLTIYLLLVYVSGVVGLMATGVSVGAALLHSTVIGALGVLVNQIYKQFVVKQN